MGTDITWFCLYTVVYRNHAPEKAKSILLLLLPPQPISGPVRKLQEEIAHAVVVDYVVSRYNDIHLKDVKGFTRHKVQVFFR